MNPATSPQTGEAIAVVYRVLNDYAGSIGEVLGVSLFAALWLVIVALTILRTNVLYQILLGYPRFSRANNRLPLRFGLLGIGVM